MAAGLRAPQEHAEEVRTPPQERAEEARILPECAAAEGARTPPRRKRASSTVTAVGPRPGRPRRAADHHLQARRPGGSRRHGARVPLVRAAIRGPRYIENLPGGTLMLWTWMISAAATLGCGLLASLLVGRRFATLKTRDSDDRTVGVREQTVNFFDEHNHATMR